MAGAGKNTLIFYLFGFSRSELSDQLGGDLTKRLTAPDANWSRRKSDKKLGFETISKKWTVNRTWVCSWFLPAASSSFVVAVTERFAVSDVRRHIKESTPFRTTRSALASPWSSWDIVALCNHHTSGGTYWKATTKEKRYIYCKWAAFRTHFRTLNVKRQPSLLVWTPPVWACLRWKEHYTQDKTTMGWPWRT